MAMGHQLIEPCGFSILDESMITACRDSNRNEHKSFSSSSKGIANHRIEEHHPSLSFLKQGDKDDSNRTPIPIPYYKLCGLTSMLGKGKVWGLFFLILPSPFSLFLLPLPVFLLSFGTPLFPVFLASFLRLSPYPCMLPLVIFHSSGANICRLGPIQTALIWFDIAYLATLFLSSLFLLAVPRFVFTSCITYSE